MLAVPALAILLAQSGSPCSDDPDRPAAVHLCRADQHLAAYRPDVSGNRENDKHLLEAVEDLKQATTASRGTSEFGTAALRLVRLFAPDRLNEPDKAIPVLQHVIEAEPANLEARFTLAAVLEAEGDIDQAGQLLEQTYASFPKERAAASQLAGFTHRLAARVWENVSRTDTLDDETRAAQLKQAASVETRALDIDPAFTDALTTKELIVRALASAESDANARAALVREADDLRARAVRQQQGRGLAALAKRSTPGEGGSNTGIEWLRPPSRTYRGGSGGSPVLSADSAATPVQSGNVAGAAATAAAAGQESVSATRIKYVPPVYPPDAVEMGVEGIVVVEIGIDEQGKVSDAKVVQGSPLLNQAALDAVRQWEYAPAVRDGKPTPIRATVTVGFTLK